MSQLINKTKLNDSQIQAITHKLGPLLIIAGAGTGKTTVVTERVKWLIESNLAKPEEILCLTFTEKAAREMQERIDVAMPLGYGEIWINTFHSFSDRILRNESINIGLDPNYRLLTEAECISFLQANIYLLPLSQYRPLGNPNKFLSALLQHFSRLKDEDVSPSEYIDWVTKATDIEDIEKYQELSQSYQVYEDLKIKNSYMDFSDLISHTLSLFRKKPSILKEYQRKFKYILVDEYQDTNYAQTLLVNLLANAERNLTVVADDDQAIYRFRGASVSNVLQFRTTYPDSKLVTLTQNYRSTQEILNKAHQLIQHNNPDRLEFKEGIDKRLQSSYKKNGDPVQHLSYVSLEREVEGVAREIKKLTTQTSNPYQLSDVAILVRANSHAQPFVRMLTGMGIPVSFMGPSKLFEQTEIKDIISYLRVLANPLDSQSLYRLLSSQFHQINGRDMAMLLSYSKKTNQDLFEVVDCAIKNLPPPAGVSPLVVSSETLKILSQLMLLIDGHLTKITTQTATQNLYEYLKHMNLLPKMIDNIAPFSTEVTLNISKLIEKITAYESLNPNHLTQQVVHWLDLMLELGDSPLANESDWSDQDSVKIFTIHSAKGLEFPVVFMVNMVSQRFPSVARREPIPIPEKLIREQLPSGDFHIQEERRLCYVGITRAKEKLYLTSANFYGDSKRQKQPSIFITEILGDQALLTTAKDQSSQLNLLDWQFQSSATTNSKPNPELKIDYISYSQIQTFLDCPLHYKARYILKIPAPPNAYANFGNIIHQTIKDFYIWAKRQANIPDVSDCLNYMLNSYSTNWTPIGFNGKNEEEGFRQKGVQYLTNYINNQFNPNLLPDKLEEPFSVGIVRKSDKKYLKIGGKIDRVDVYPDGTIEIIDYKTSSRPIDQKQADDSLQLSFYALAANLLPGPIFNKPPEKIKLSLYYFDTQTKITSTRSLEDLESAKDKIFSYVDQILNSDFKCSGTITCEKCDYKLLCDPGKSI